MKRNKGILAGRGLYQCLHMMHEQQGGGSDFWNVVLDENGRGIGSRGSRQPGARCAQKDDHDSDLRAFSVSGDAVTGGRDRPSQRLPFF
jgi:hypothetical protein